MTGTASMLELDLMARDPENPKYAHEAWLIEQSIRGWRWGVEFNAEKKTNPRFMPYESLPENVR